MSQFKAPDPESLVATHPESGARLYASLAPCPLYVNARLLPGPAGFAGKRKSYWLGYVIEEKRLARAWAIEGVKEPLFDWAVKELRELYPSVEEAAGLTAEEVAEIKAEQRAKRQVHENKGRK